MTDREGMRLARKVIEEEYITDKWKIARRVRELLGEERGWGKHGQDKAFTADDAERAREECALAVFGLPTSRISVQKLKAFQAFNEGHGILAAVRRSGAKWQTCTEWFDEWKSIQAAKDKKPRTRPARAVDLRFAYGSGVIFGKHTDRRSIWRK